jgi:ribonuclease Z
MSEIVFLGTCGNQTATAEAVAFVVMSDNDNLLIDAGPGVVRQIYASGLQPSDINAVLLTHAHADHVAGFAYFVWSRFYDSLGGAEPKDLRVLAPEHMITGLKSMLEFSYNPVSFPFVIQWEGLSSSGPDCRSTNGFQVTTTPVDHTVITLGSRIDLEDGTSVAYSADTLYASNFVELARDVPVLIHEAFVTSQQADLSQRTKHATAAEAGRVARECGASRLYMVHYFPPLAGKLDMLVEEAHTEFAGSVQVPVELERIKL